MRYYANIILVMLIAITLSRVAIGAAVIPWPRNMAAPGILFLAPGNQQDVSGALIHELCHIRQFAEMRHITDDATDLELECSCAEYFYYESIGYEPGMERVLHYDIP